jgi:FkbM family methyltransferase
MKIRFTQVLRSTRLYKPVVSAKRWLSAHNPFRSRQDAAEAAAAAQFYAEFVRDGDLCFDIGAHQGIRTDVFLRLGAKVVAVEPQKELAQALKSKYRGNGRVAVVGMGLDAKEGERTLYMCNYSTCSSMSHEWIDSVKDWRRLQGRTWDSKTTVQVTTLDRLVQEHGVPAFCKIDVEGFEWNVLQGLSRAVPALSLEYNPRHLGVVAQCVEHLQALAEYEYNYSEGDSMGFSGKQWVNAEGIRAVIRDVLPQSVVYGDLYARRKSARPHYG